MPSSTVHPQFIAYRAGPQGALISARQGRRQHLIFRLAPIAKPAVPAAELKFCNISRCYSALSPFAELIKMTFGNKFDRTHVEKVGH